VEYYFHYFSIGNTATCIIVRQGLFASISAETPRVFRTRFRVPQTPPTSRQSAGTVVLYATFAHFLIHFVTDHLPPTAQIIYRQCTGWGRSTDNVTK